MHSASPTSQLCICPKSPVSRLTGTAHRQAVSRVRPAYPAPSMAFFPVHGFWSRGGLGRLLVMRRSASRTSSRGFRRYISSTRRSYRCRNSTGSGRGLAVLIWFSTLSDPGSRLCKAGCFNVRLCSSAKVGHSGGGSRIEQQSSSEVRCDGPKEGYRRNTSAERPIKHSRVVQKLGGHSVLDIFVWFW